MDARQATNLLNASARELGVTILDANALTVTTCLNSSPDTSHTATVHSSSESESEPESDYNSELNREVNDIMMDVFGDCDIHNLSDMEN